MDKRRQKERKRDSGQWKSNALTTALLRYGMSQNEYKTAGWGGRMGAKQKETDTKREKEKRISKENALHT